MEYLVDWNCHLMPGMRERISDSKESLKTLRFLQDQFSFTHFCMMPDYDCTREPASIFFLRLERSKELLKGVLEPSFKIRYIPRVLMAPNVHLNEGLEKFLTTKNHFLPIRLPISEYEDWIDFEINRLLYHKKLNLWFTSFEQSVLLYPTHIIEKLTNIPHAVFQFGYKSLVNQTVRNVILKLIQNNRIVLLGSMVDCLERAYQFDLPYYEKTAREYLSNAVYQTLIRQNRYFWMKYF